MTQREPQTASPTEVTDAHRLSTRILVVAPTGRDAALTADFLSDAGFSVDTAGSTEELAREIARGAAAALIASEALDDGGITILREVLDRQPPWSDLPLLVFVSPADPSRAAALEVLGPRAHLTLVDRPIQVATLLSAVRAALRVRSRQYELQRLLVELADTAARERLHAERLAALAQASVSIASARSLEDVLTLITNQARALLDAPFAVTRVAATGGGEPIMTFSCAAGYDSWRAAFATTDEAMLDQLCQPFRFVEGDRRRTAFDGLLYASGADRLPHNAIGMGLVGEKGERIGFVVVCDDGRDEFNAGDEAVVTQLAQMASAAVQRAQLYREAQEANRAKDDFLATLAHELRTPMTAVLGWVQMLKAGDLQPDDVGDAIEMIESSTKVQSHLIEDLLDVSRIIAGKLKIQQASVHLGEIIERVLATFRNAAAAHGVNLTSAVTDESLAAWADSTRLQQVVWNLLSNALKFTPAGGTVHVSLAREGASAAIRVKDTGEGIDPDLLPHVFERFRQAERGTTKSHAGLGLGLAIVRHLVELHGGTVEAFSDGPGRGAEFVVCLPLSPVHPADVQEISAEALPELSGHKILVVDDDANALHLMEHVLERFGAEVVTVASTADAVAALRTYDADLVISDIAMPGEDGYALMRCLRAIESDVGHDIPAMALTGYGREQDRLRILSAGFRRYVQKPVQPTDLARIVAELLHR
ncbi:MAG TPA: ATP-binding protein [Thermoanaerobaculia bacterium]|nr:ATP-binding protein [Thermoanaerobaculia bacterium]